MHNIFKPFLIFLLLLFLFIPQALLADTPCNDKSDSKKVECLTDLMAEYESKIKDLQGKQKTLATTIGVLDSQIILTQTKVKKTEQEIGLLQKEVDKLSIKIEKLSEIVVDVSTLLALRIEETYKRLFLPQIYFFFSSSGFSDFVSRLKYLKMVQKNDREILFELEKAKQNFDAQKDLKEEKQEELEVLQDRLETQKVLLAQQKVNKQELLNVTKNDEQNFQNLLAQIRNEYQAILAILAGKGEETKVGEVKKGERIASVIQGKSCNSSATHLHFTVADDSGNPSDPFNYLKGVDYKNCSSCYSNQSCPCPNTDPFNPGGDWDWPLNPTIILSQGYGRTWAVEHTWVGQIYQFHNGIDIIGSSNDVKAVQAGTLYRGSYTGSEGCRLPYVRVDHKDGDLNTYFLHVI